MTITYHEDVVQGSEEWAALRCGILTASEMKLIITPTLKIADNDKTRAHVYELLAQRITGYVEPQYVSDDMLRGQTDEIEARALYSKHYAPVQTVGFITNDEWGFTLGYSPDGLIGSDGLLECKSRRQKYQIEAIIKAYVENAIVDDYIIQAQTGLLVTGRKFMDHASFSGGLPMPTIPVRPDEKIQEAIIAAATAFEAKIAEKRALYEAALKSSSMRLIATERRVEQEMYI